MERIRAKQKAGKNLSPTEKGILAAAERSINVRDVVWRARWQQVADKIAEADLILRLPPTEIWRYAGFKNQNLYYRFRKIHPDVVATAYIKMESTIDLQRQERSIKMLNELSSLGGKAVEVFKDHLDGKKKGDLPAIVRQRAAEQIKDVLVKQVSDSTVHHIHDVSPHIANLITSRQRGERPNELPTTRDVAALQEGREVDVQGVVVSAGREEREGDDSGGNGSGK